MKEFRKILFPVDLSATSAQLVSHARMMLEKFDAKLYLLFVARDFSYFTSIYVPHPSVDHFKKEIAEGGRKGLDNFSEEHFGDIPDVTTAVLTGDPSEQILAYTESENIDMIVIGTHGRRGMERAIFGSVAERVISRAKVPVFVVNPYFA